MLEYRVFSTRWGFIGLVGHDRKASSLTLPVPVPEMVHQYLHWTGGVKLVENPTLLTGLTEQLKAYFAGQRVDSWDCDPELTAVPNFTRQVLLAAARIPYGTVQTYGSLARELGRSRGARAVGQALKRNPLPIIIPCHRVVASNGLGDFPLPGVANQSPP